MSPTKQVIRSLSVFFAVMFGILFAGFVVDAASGGSPRSILHSMLVSECACGLFVMIAAAVDPKVSEN